MSEMKKVGERLKNLIYNEQKNDFLKVSRNILDKKLWKNISWALRGKPTDVEADSVHKDKEHYFEIKLTKYDPEAPNETDLFDVEMFRRDALNDERIQTYKSKEIKGLSNLKSVIKKYEIEYKKFFK